MNLTLSLFDNGVRLHFNERNKLKLACNAHAVLRTLNNSKKNAYIRTRSVFFECTLTLPVSNFVKLIFIQTFLIQISKNVSYLKSFKMNWEMSHLGS